MDIREPAPAVGPPPITVLDWVGAAVTAATIVGLVLFPVSGFRAVFHDLGPTDDLPLLTRIVLYRGASPALALPALASFGLAFMRRQPLSRRRMWMLAAFGLACLGTVLCVLAMYLPIFSIAGRIKAD